MFNHRRPVCLQAAIERFLTDLAVTGRARTTLALYRCLLAGLARSISPKRPVRMIHHDDAVHYLAVLAASNSQAYVNLNARLFKHFFAWLVAEKEMTKNPLAGIQAKDPPWTPVPPFSQDECQRLLRAARSPLERIVVLLLLDCGLRASELTGLRLPDIDLKENYLTIRGKGGKRRFLALNPGPRQALLNYLDSQGHQDGLIWPAGWNRKNLAYLLDKIGRHAQVYPMFPHRCRHTWASEMKRQGVDSLVLMQLAGWQNVGMVERYTRLVAQECALDAHRRHSLGDRLGG